MTAFRKILLLPLLMLCFHTFAQTDAAILMQQAKPFYEVQFLKVSSNNNRWKAVRVNIDVNGEINNGSKNKGKLPDLAAFTQSVTQLITTASTVVKVEGDNDDRNLGIQDPHGRQNIYITVILRADYDKEAGIKNPTCYRYRETDLGVKETNYAFYNYFSKADSALLKKLLR